MKTSKWCVWMGALSAMVGLSSNLVMADDHSHKDNKCGSLPKERIEEIIQAEGMCDNGVLDIEIERKDIGEVQGPLDVIFTPAFEIHGDLYFQSLGGDRAFLNGDMALKENEVNPFIAVLLTKGLVWQAYHQHLPMVGNLSDTFSPQIWFVHFRGVGKATYLAEAIKEAINVTSTPFPQTMPQHPTTPLDPQRLARILKGSASVGEEGVVTVTVPRTDKVTIDGIEVKPEAGISTTIEFKPLGHDGQAAVVPDFSMECEEIQPVVKTMLLRFYWYQGCLYNQETCEHPQLYFDHMLKVGDAYELAREIRKGLDYTDTKH